MKQLVTPMLSRSLLFLIFLIFFSFTANAQQGRPPIDDKSTTSSKSQEEIPLGSPEQEMIKRVGIKHEEELHRENLERARENAQIGAELRDTFTRSKALSPADIKKLNRMEKLTRRIRSEAGGSDDEEVLKDPPSALDAALARLAESAEELRKGVEKTSRLVISAAVIERANEMLELIRRTRNFIQ